MAIFTERPYSKNFGLPYTFPYISNKDYSHGITIFFPQCIDVVPCNIDRWKLGTMNLNLPLTPVIIIVILIMLQYFFFLFQRSTNATKPCTSASTSAPTYLALMSAPVGQGLPLPPTDSAAKVRKIKKAASSIRYKGHLSQPNPLQRPLVTAQSVTKATCHSPIRYKGHLSQPNPLQRPPNPLQRSLVTAQSVTKATCHFSTSTSHFSAMDHVWGVNLETLIQIA